MIVTVEGMKEKLGMTIPEAWMVTSAALADVAEKHEGMAKYLPEMEEMVTDTGPWLSREHSSVANVAFVQLLTGVRVAETARLSRLARLSRRRSGPISGA